MQKTSVLLVDDDRDLLDIFSFDLEEAGFVVSQAQSGNIAWDLLSKSNYELIISDLYMPDGNGLDLLSRIKKTRPEQPFALFFSEPEYGKIANAYALGANDLLFKPISAELLVSTARRLVLAPSERWTKKDPSLKQGQTLLAEATEMDFGQGGMFLRVPTAGLPTMGTLLGFKVELKIGGKPPVYFEGEGLVRWLSNDAGLQNSSLRGMGIEFTYLDATSRQLFIEFISKRSPSAYIPHFQNLPKIA